MKKILVLIAIITLCSCQSLTKKEASKTLKHDAASGRINSSQGNNESILKDLD